MVEVCLQTFPQLLAAPWAQEGTLGCWTGSHGCGGGSVSTIHPPSPFLGGFLQLQPGSQEGLPQPSSMGGGRSRGGRSLGGCRTVPDPAPGAPLAPQHQLRSAGSRLSPSLAASSALAEGRRAVGEQRAVGRGCWGGATVSLWGSRCYGGPYAVAVPPSAAPSPCLPFQPRLSRSPFAWFSIPTADTS